METFYSVLGVGRDADRQTIVRAYRDKAKSHHPDVCDEPDARETFKRLTTAKEVLVDETKRSQYDTLGHDSYLQRHGECCGWSAPTQTETGIGPTAASATATSTSSASRAARAYADGGSGANGPSPSRNSSQGRSSGTATSYYRPGKRMNPGAADAASNGLLSRFQSVGAWLFLDVLLLVSAVATAWLILSWGSLSALSVLIAAVLFVAALATTSVHLSVRAYA